MILNKQYMRYAMNQVRLTGRLLRLGASVLSIDTDMSVLADPHLNKQYPINNKQYTIHDTQQTIHDKSRCG